MTENAQFAEVFGTAPLMAIMRGMGVERTLAVAAAAWDLGIAVVEVPIQTPTDLEALRAVADAARERGATVGSGAMAAVGAGTVVSVDQVRAACEAGATFTVSPGFDLEVVRASAAAGLPPMPGVATATEVQLALKEGLTWLKAFPASVLGTGWLKALHGPFPDAVFVATGGMNAGNAPAFLAGGARVVAVGSALEDDAQLPELARLLR